MSLARLPSPDFAALALSGLPDAQQFSAVADWLSDQDGAPVLLTQANRLDLEIWLRRKATSVRRMERALDEIVADAMQDRPPPVPPAPPTGTWPVRPLNIVPMIGRGVRR